MSDACDVADGTSDDCNSNVVPDSCEIFGDVAWPFAYETTGAQPDLDDILCLIDDFADGSLVNGCATSAYTTDLSPCEGDGSLDLDDVLAVVDAFGGLFACPFPCE